MTWINNLHTTVAPKCRKAIRKAVLIQVGAVHQILGGGVAFVLMCFRTYKFVIAKIVAKYYN